MKKLLTLSFLALGLITVSAFADAAPFVVPAAPAAPAPAAAPSDAAQATQPTKHKKSGKKHGHHAHKKKQQPATEQK